MTSERWNQVDEIFQAAIELRPEERHGFLEIACSGDDELRREVESLITADDHGLSFIDEPAVQVAASLIATGEPELAEGQSIGHYEIVGLVARGGMGEVYLAKDNRLNRQIALKLLPADYTKHKDRLRRFRREAEAASALNHPNILTIHELGEVGERQFIATEFIEGETLRQRLKHGPLPLSEVLEIAVQIASALAAAHQAGIVHRDIKPENIMVRPDGYVKVLDFGLAKLTQQEDRPRKPIEADKTVMSSGLLMGTIKYMSPEQARGQSVDTRSDIFSYGVVLYELLAGRAPFEGETTSELIASILKKDPPLLGAAPVELQQIISKALRKKKEDRYQNIQELLVDLRSLKQDEAASGGGVQGASDSTSGTGLSTGETGAVSTQSTVESIVSGIKRHKTITAFILVSLVIVGVGLTGGLGRLTTRLRPLSKQMRIERIPAIQKAVGVAVSPDGQYIAYTHWDGSLWVRQFATNDSIQIAPPANILFPIYSPDSSNIFYVSNEVLYRIPARGGEVTKVLAGLTGPWPISLSPDGKQFAFVRILDDDSTLLQVASVDGTGERSLASRNKPELLYSPAWSPDGSLIACAYGPTNLELGLDGLSVLGIRVATGQEEQITNFKWQAFDRLAWLPDGSGLVATAMEEGASPKQIWQISYPGGEPHKITNDFETYVDLSLSADGKSMVTTQGTRLSNLWVSPSGDLKGTKSVPFGERMLAPNVSWTPDGRILCPLNNGGERDIWIVNADGTNPKQLTANAGKHLGPRASPDGRYVVFSANRASSGNYNIWRTNIDGSDPIQLTTGDGEVTPTVSPDGLWVVYSKGGPDTGIDEKTIWKVPIDGGASVQLTSTSSSGAVVSPDGTLIACWYKQDETSPWQIALIPFTGGEPVKTLDVKSASIIPLRWTPDGRAVSYVDTSDGNIWKQPIDGSPPTQVTQLTSDRILGFDWSRDGQLAYVRIHDSRDVVLITDFN